MSQVDMYMNTHMWTRTEQEYTIWIAAHYFVYNTDNKCGCVPVCIFVYLLCRVGVFAYFYHTGDP